MHMSADQDAPIVQPIKDQLVRQKALVLAAAESVSDPKVADELRDLANGIESCIHDYLDHGALFLIRRAGEREKEFVEFDPDLARRIRAFAR